MFIDRWMDKEDVEYIDNGILLSHKKNEIMPFAEAWMDLEILRVSEVSQTKTNIWYCLHVESKIWYKWTYLQNRNRLTDMKSKEKGDELGLADTNCYSWTFKLQTFKVGNMHLVSARNQNLCRHPQVWVKLRLALHLLLLMILQLYHLSHPLLPPVYSSSCLSTLCQPLYSQLLYCTSILFKAL